MGSDIEGQLEVLDKYCAYINEETGDRCNAYRQKTSVFCFTHDPLQKEAHMRAVAEGGRSKGFLCKLKPVEIKDLDDVISFVGTCVNEVRRGTLDPRVANSFFYGAGVLIRALEVKRNAEEKNEVDNKINKMVIVYENRNTDNSLTDIRKEEN